MLCNSECVESGKVIISRPEGQWKDLTANYAVWEEE